MLIAAVSQAPQSALSPASDPAGLIHQVSLVLTIGTVAIFVLVMALVLYGALSGQRRVNARAWILGGGIVFPAVVLLALFLYALQVGHALSVAPAREADIEVTGRMWWWDVRYRDPRSGAWITAANELYIPVGRPVELALRSEDVIHSFWVPALAGKVDMIPGRVNRLVLHARERGVFRGQCAEYCGMQHAWMALHVVAVPEEEYEAWLARQAAPAREPVDAALRRGRDALLRENCGTCHAIRGTAAAGTLGPDLTHVGSRSSLAAGRLGNNASMLAAWIAGSQSIKPGNLMPSSNAFTGEELRLVAAYLESLE
jgi:cytochrome c oxidase subunit II